MQNTIADVPHQALREVRHQYTNPNTQWTGKTEDDIGDYEALEVEVGLGNVQPQTECDDSLVDHDCNDDGQELACIVLKTDGDTLED